MTGWVEGFDEVYRASYPAMVRLAYVMLGSRSEAETLRKEVVQ